MCSLREKTNKSLPEALTAEELRDRPTDAGVPDDDDEGDPWDALDVNEYEGPSVGKAKASHLQSRNHRRPPQLASPPERMSSAARSVQNMPEAM